MIEIYIGNERPDDHLNDVIVLDNVSQYIDLRSQIRLSVTNSTNLTIWVKNPICRDWFWDLETWPRVSIKKISLLERFRSHLGIQTVPDFIYSNPDLISELELLEVSARKLENESVEEWILRTRLGEEWVASQPSLEHFMQLISWFTYHEIPKNLEVLSSGRLNSWITQLGHGTTRKLYENILQNSQNRVKSLIFHNILSTYPKKNYLEWLNSKPWFDDSLILPTTTSTNFQDIEIDISQEFGPNIARYWDEYIQDIQLSSEVSKNELMEIIIEILSRMTGKVISEIDRLNVFLINYIERVSSPLVALIEAKFKLLEGSSDYISKLRTKIPPQYPTTPSTMWDLNEWMQWVVYEYLPYRKWLFLNKRFDKQLDNFSLVFENWLHSNYPEIIARSDRNLVSNNYEQIKNALELGKQVIWFFIDNLSYFWFSELISAMRNKGLEPKEHIPQIAMLPSITDISRPVALLGRTPISHHQKGTNIRDKLETEVKLVFRDYNPTIISDLYDLEKLITSQTDLILVIYNRIDDLSHNQLSVSQRYEEIKSHLAQLSDKASYLVNTLSKFRDTSIYISTDHGCTYVDMDSNPLKIPDFIKNRNDIDLHQRYIKYDIPKQFDENPWFVLSPDYYELPQYYATPKGRVSVGGNAKGLVHGGLTPEEVVVPFINFEVGVSVSYSKIEFEQVSVLRILDGSQKLTIRVYNPMDLAIMQLNIEIPAFKATFGTISTLDEHSYKDIETSVLVPPTNEQYFLADVTYSATTDMGVELSDSIKVNFSLSRIYKSEMDDMFGND